jgi:hypothetical protein
MPDTRCDCILADFRTGAVASVSVISCADRCLRNILVLASTRLLHARFLPYQLHNAQELYVPVSACSRNSLVSVPSRTITLRSKLSVNCRFAALHNRGLCGNSGRSCLIHSLSSTGSLSGTSDAVSRESANAKDKHDMNRRVKFH